MTRSLESIRADFPALERRENGNGVAYFDGPGGTQVPRPVAEAMTDYLFHHNANTHWVYPTSAETDAMLEDARGKFADLFNATPADVSFGNNMTTIAFHLSRGLARNWKAGSACIPGGLAGALLTCLASVGVNLLVDYGGMAFPAVLYLRKLATGYAAAASVVIVVFPLWPLMTRRLRSPALVETPR